MKSIQLKIEAAKEELIKAISEISNSQGLDYYFLFFILKDITTEVEIQKNNELNNLKIEEENSQKEKEVKKNEKN